MNEDRTVHASSEAMGMEVVRYDRAGKWYLEPTDKSLPRQAVTIDKAVEYASWLWDRKTGQVHFDRPGGSRFDQLVRRRFLGRDV